MINDYRNFSREEWKNSKVGDYYLRHNEWTKLSVYHSRIFGDKDFVEARIHLKVPEDKARGGCRLQRVKKFQIEDVMSLHSVTNLSERLCFFCPSTKEL